MPNEFRFLVLCIGATMRESDRFITLGGIVNELVGSASERTELLAVVGAILRPPMFGKRLDLMAWILGKTGERLPLAGYVAPPLFLPHVIGPQVFDVPCSLPTPRSGIYGFELFDRQGAFGPSESLLATYLFSVGVD